MKVSAEPFANIDAGEWCVTTKRGRVREPWASIVIVLAVPAIGLSLLVTMLALMLLMALATPAILLAQVMPVEPDPGADDATT